MNFNICFLANLAQPYMTLLFFSGSRVDPGAVERAAGGAGGRDGDAGVQDQAGQPQAAGHVEEEGEIE